MLYNLENKSQLVAAHEGYRAGGSLCSALNMKDYSTEKVRSYKLALHPEITGSQIPNCMTLMLFTWVRHEVIERLQEMSRRYITLLVHSRSK